MQVVLIRGVIIIISIRINSCSVIVRQSRLCLSRISVRAHVGGGLATASLDHSVGWKLTLDILVVLVLASKVLGAFA